MDSNSEDHERISAVINEIELNNHELGDYHLLNVPGNYFFYNSMIPDRNIFETIYDTDIESPFDNLTLNKILNKILDMEYAFVKDIARYKCKLDNPISISIYNYVLYILNGTIDMCKTIHIPDRNIFKLMFMSYGRMLDNILDTDINTENEIFSLSKKFARSLGIYYISHIKDIISLHEYNTKRHMVLYLELVESYPKLYDEFIAIDNCICIDYNIACKNIIKNICNDGYPDTLIQIRNVKNLIFLCENMFDKRFYIQKYTEHTISKYTFIDIILNEISKYDKCKQRSIYETIKTVVHNCYIKSNHITHILDSALQ
jgi:hypothetical protein